MSGQEREGPRYTIGKAARAAGVTAKTIRYYERVGLIAPHSRQADNNYRLFDDEDITRLRFIGRARQLGFSIADIRALLSLHGDRTRPSREVKRLAEAHLARIEHKIAELEALRVALAALIAQCHGDDRPDCPILEALGREASSPHGSGLRK